MASQDEIDELKRIAGPAIGTLSDEQISTALDAATSVNSYAASLWDGYAASTAIMVNVSESGSSRSLSDIHKHALSMADRLRARDAEVAPVITGRTTTRPIVRG